MHRVIVGILGLDRQEGARADMQGQRFMADPGFVERGHQRGREMERGGGCGDRAILVGEHRLIIIGITRIGRALAGNIGW